MRKPLIAVLGCGPAGLLAAHALTLFDMPHVIFSPKVKSKLGGAQYSHVPIPGIHNELQPDGTLTYKVEGDADIYRRKVYADRPDVPFVSFNKESDGKLTPAWSLGVMYDTLWSLYEDKVVDSAIDPAKFFALMSGFDIVFNSAPANRMCRALIDPNVNHWFKHATVRIVNEAIMDIPDNTIYYDGTEDHSWYRMSKIFGVGSTEWGVTSAMPPLGGVRTVDKPFGTNCDCNPGVVRIGRFGTWDKGELTFHAFNRTIDTLAKMGAIDGSSIHTHA